MQREEDRLCEMGTAAHVGGASISNEEQLQKKEESIIKPKRRAEAGSRGKEIDLGGHTLF